MSSSIKKHLVNFLVITYFVNAMMEIIAEFYSANTFIFFTKPLIPFLLITLYWFSSKKRNMIFIIIMLFSLLTNILFIPKAPQALFYGVIAYTAHRILLLYFIYTKSKIKSYKIFVLVTVPLFAIFSYLFFASSDVPENTYTLLIIHNIMGAIIGGIGITNYIVNDNKENSLLMISTLLFLGLQMVIYVERYYLYNVSLEYIRPLAMLLNVLAFFTFYKYVMVTESDYNSSAV